MISIGKYGTYNGSQSSPNHPLIFIIIINYFPAIIMSLSIIQKYQETGFNFVIKFSGSV